MTGWKPTKREFLRASGVPDELLHAEWFTQSTGGRVPRRDTADHVALMVVYIDTVQVFLRSVRPSDRARIMDVMHRGGDWFLKDCKIEIGLDVVTAGFQLKVQLPQQPAVAEIDRMLAELRGFNDDQPGSLTQLHYSVDFLPLGGRSRYDVDAWLWAHVIMRNRRAGKIFRFDGNTSYFNKNAHRLQNSCDLVHYSDKPSKHPILGSEPITHLDIRLRGKQTLDRLHIASLADAMAVNPADVVRRFMYFTDVDIRPHAEADALATGSRYADAKLLDAYIHRRQLHFAQQVKDQLRVAMPEDPIPPLLISPKFQFL